MSSESYFKVPKEKDFLKIIEDAEDAGVLDKAAKAVKLSSGITASSAQSQQEQLQSLPLMISAHKKRRPKGRLRESLQDSRGKRWRRAPSLALLTKTYLVNSG